MKIHLGPRDDYLGATNVRVADSVLVGGRVGLSGTLGDVVGDDGVAGGKKGKLLLLQQLSLWLVCVIGGAVVVVGMRLCIDWFFLSLSLWPRWLWSLWWAAVPYGYILFLLSSEVGLGCVANGLESVLAAVEYKQYCKYQEYGPHGLL